MDVAVETFECLDGKDRAFQRGLLRRKGDIWLEIREPLETMSLEFLFASFLQFGDGIGFDEATRWSRLLRHINCVMVALMCVIVTASEHVSGTVFHLTDMPLQPDTVLDIPVALLNGNQNAASPTAETNTNTSMDTSKHPQCLPIEQTSCL
jgi:hypothetical protein